MREPVFTDTLQIATVVRDLEATMRTSVEDYGIGPWEVNELDPRKIVPLGEGEPPTDAAWRLAVTMVGSVQWELVQPLDDRSIYADFLASKGEGLHHVAVGGTPYRETIAGMRANGRRVVLGGVYGGRDVRVPLDRRAPQGAHRDLRLARGPRPGVRRGLPAVGRRVTHVTPRAPASRGADPQAGSRRRRRR